MPRRMKQTFHRLGEILLRKDAVRAQDVDEALAVQRAEIEAGRTPRRLGAILVEHKILDKLTIREILAEQRLRRGWTRIFRIDLQDYDGIAVLCLIGRFTQQRSESVTRVLENLMNRGFARVVVDASRLSYLNSRGVSAFISYIDEARARGGDLKFAGLGPSSLLVLRRLGLDRFLQTFKQREEALRAFDLPIDEYMAQGALGEYVASIKGRHFHLSYCQTAQKIVEDDRTYYESKWHARSDGKRSCPKCKP